jgi:hypothetical protein
LSFRSKLNESAANAVVSVVTSIHQCSYVAPFDGKRCPVDNFLWDEQNMHARCAIASVSRSIRLGLANKISYIMPSVLVIITARNHIAVDQPRRKHTVKAHVSTENVASNGTLAIQQEEARRAKFSRMSRCSPFRDLLSIRGVCCRLDH